MNPNHICKNFFTLQNGVLARRNKDNVVGIVVKLWAV